MEMFLPAVQPPFSLFHGVLVLTFWWVTHRLVTHNFLLISVSLLTISQIHSFGQKEGKPPDTLLLLVSPLMSVCFISCSLEAYSLFWAVFFLCIQGLLLLRTSASSPPLLCWQVCVHFTHIHKLNAPPLADTHIVTHRNAHIHTYTHIFNH